MENKNKLLILLGVLIFTPFMISTHAAMVDPLAVDCRTGFITGSLWSGEPVPEEEIVLTLQDIVEPVGSKRSTPTTQEEGEQVRIDAMLEGAREVLEAVSVSRGEDESHRDNIRAFIKSLREVTVSKSTNPDTLKRALGIILTKYTG